ncbi:DUF1232 domain-containing protein [Planctomycetota bacterium]|nr:DUF1232 domain-containing protein [Planctomycetota bacterium]
MKVSEQVNDGVKGKVVGKPGFIKRVMAGIGLIVCVVYLLNFSFGFIGEIPDNLPVVGNIDEVFVSMILFTCLGVLGVRLPGQWR